MPSTRRETESRRPTQARAPGAAEPVPAAAPPADAAREEDDEGAVRRLDEACVVRALAGDARAFEELYERHRQTVYWVALKVVKNEEDALDVVQDAFIKAWERLSQFERRSSPRTWLCQIALNGAIDRTRRKKVRKATGLEDYMTGAEASRSGTGLAHAGTLRADGAGGGPRPELDPSLIAQGDELRAALDGALAVLSAKHRDVFELYTAKGLSYREIAKILGVQLGTVMSRLFYARKRLQEMLADFQGELERAGSRGATAPPAFPPGTSGGARGSPAVPMGKDRGRAP